MAKGPLMLQVRVNQTTGGPHTELPIVDALVFDTLDGGVTTVREIATQKLQFIGLPNDELVLGATVVSAVLSLPHDPLVILHAPSSVGSPPIAGAGMAILQIFDFGLKGNEDQVQFSRAVAAHAYLDEVQGGPTAPVDAGVVQSSLEEQWVEVAWQGPGELTLRFIDREGQALLEENISAFGSPAIQCRTRRPLTLLTRDRKVEVAPVVLSRAARPSRLSHSTRSPGKPTSVAGART